MKSLTLKELRSMERDFEEFLRTHQEDEEDFEPYVPSQRELIIRGENKPEPDASWMVHGLCRGLGCDLFFPERGKNTPVEIKRMCARCPVKQECLDYAIDYDINHGVWGGESETGIRAIRKARKARSALEEQESPTVVAA